MQPTPWQNWANAVRDAKKAKWVVRHTRRDVDVKRRAHGKALLALQKASKANAMLQTTHASLCAVGVTSLQPKTDTARLAVDAATDAALHSAEALQRCMVRCVAAEAAAVAAAKAVQHCRLAVEQAAGGAVVVDNADADSDAYFLHQWNTARRAAREARRMQGSALAVTASAVSASASTLIRTPYWCARVAALAATWFVPTAASMRNAAADALPRCFWPGNVWFTVKKWVLAVDAAHPAGAGAPNIAAIDPGVRTFLTIYCPGVQQMYEIGTAADGAMLRNAAAAGEQTLADFVKVLHSTVADWLVRTFAAVYLPELGTAAQHRSCRLQIGASVAEDLRHWNHGGFLETLQRRAESSPLKPQIYVCSEAYTTRTCSSCGVLARFVGAAAVFVCRACKVHIPRDWNGARGIALQNYCVV